jgi:hypothetical protein
MHPKHTLCEQALGKIQGFVDIPLVCTNNPGKNSSQTMWSLGVWGGVVHRIPARPAAGLAGKDLGRGLVAHGGPMVAGVGAGRHWRGVHEGQRLGGRRRRNAGEETARPGNKRPGKL